RVGVAKGRKAIRLMLCRALRSWSYETNKVATFHGRTEQRLAREEQSALKALVKKHAEPGLWLEDVPEPTFGVNDVLIRVDRTGICGTDVHIYAWDAWAQKTIPVPMVVGHEFVGEIVAVGSNVTDFHVGEVVSGEGHVVCGRCRNCLAGRRHLCKDTSGVGV